MPISMMGYSTGGAGAAGGAPTGYSPAYGGIPNLPAYTTDSSTMTGTDVQAQMLKNLPGYQQMLSQDVSNINQNLAGAPNQDVINLLQQQGAERGIATGSPGSPNADAAYLRALGLTSLQMQNLGHSQLTEAMQRTPIQQTQSGTQTTDQGAARAVYAAAPNPQAAANAALGNAMAGMKAGGGGGGGGGYSLNAAAPTAKMGYNAPSAMDSAMAWQNQWANSPQIQAANAANLAEQDRAAKWQASQGMVYNAPPNYASVPQSGGGSIAMGTQSLYDPSFLMGGQGEAMPNYGAVGADPMSGLPSTYDWTSDFIDPETGLINV